MLKYSFDECDETNDKVGLVRLLVDGVRKSFCFKTGRHCLFALKFKGKVGTKISFNISLQICER